jgi:hypothetical protein
VREEQARLGAMPRAQRGEGLRSVTVQPNLVKSTLLTAVSWMPMCIGIGTSTSPLASMPKAFSMLVIAAFDGFRCLVTVA